jgi:hypothetical protein
MTATVATATSRRPAIDRAWSHVSDGIIVGKDILELLSSSMYVDPLAIYREYVQNAADAVDDARAQGILAPNDAGEIDISVDAGVRTVRIRDNGTGVPAAQFIRRMTSFGASLKRGQRFRGFRGVGRLAGIGYAQELVFRSRAKGEKRVSELRWDCRKLKTLLRASDQEQDLQAVVLDTVSSREVSGSELPDHFFEVELCGIVRHKNDQLLNAETIHAYLAQVSPVPFAPDFPHGDAIRESVGKHVLMGDLRIQISGSDTPIFRPHRQTIPLGGPKTDEAKDIEFISVPALDGGLAAVGWILHHGYTGALPADALVRGMRLRVGNIQIGDDRLLEELFLESRFNSWCIGEVHILDGRVVPNGRRDHLEQNAHYHNLLTHLAPVAREVSRRCRASSIRRNRTKECLRLIDAANEKLSIVRQGALSRVGQSKLIRDVLAALVEAEKMIKGDVFDATTRRSISKDIERTRKAATAMQAKRKISSPLEDLPASQRRTYQQVFSLIYECAPNRTVAKAIVDRVLARLGAE